MSWAELVHERAELTMSWAELSELTHFDTYDLWQKKYDGLTNNLKNLARYFYILFMLSEYIYPVTMGRETKVTQQTKVYRNKQHMCSAVTIDLLPEHMWLFLGKFFFFFFETYL